MLFSLGCTANFWVKGKEMAKKQEFTFESGDVLIFNGSTELGILTCMIKRSGGNDIESKYDSIEDIQHGITHIIPDTTPEHFKGTLDDWRVSIQFRQCDRNDNYSYRGYYKKKT